MNFKESVSILLFHCNMGTQYATRYGEDKSLEFALDKLPYNNVPVTLGFVDGGFLLYCTSCMNACYFPKIVAWFHSTHTVMNNAYILYTYCIHISIHA